jgi:hypothetical protein
MKYIISALLLFLCQASYAENEWYWGTVNSVNTLGSDGSFQVSLENTDVKNNCSNDRVNFYVEDMGLERAKLAFSLALSAFAAGKKWGVVIDLPPSEATCNASPTASQGAGIS